MAKQTPTRGSRAARRTASRDVAKSRRRERAHLLGTPGDNRPAAWIVRHGPLLLVFAAMLFAALVRLRLADVPLERDEGEYAYAGQLILRGIAPYQLAYNMKFPGTYYAYSLILALFGETARGIHIGLLVVDAATTFVIFLLGRRLLGAFGGAIAAAAFAILSLDRGTLGAFAHATHFVLLPALAGLLLLLRSAESRSTVQLVGAGALLGTAVLMKQQAIFFLPLALGLVWWIESRSDARRLSVMAVRGMLVALGSAIPFGVLCAVLAAQGVLGRFWFWTFQYARQYVSETPLSAAWSMFVLGLGNVTRPDLPLWVLGACGLVLLWLVRWTIEARVFLSGLVIASLLAISPGFYFRNHYFVLLLPVVALLVGVAVASIARLLERVMPAAGARVTGAMLFGIIVAAYAVREQDYLFFVPARDVSKLIYGANPFADAPEIARYIRERTTAADRIAVLGSEPEIYFYANRKSATGYIYTYSVVEQQPLAPRMQAEMIHEVESAHPAYLVYIGIPTSWLARNPGEYIFTWADRYAHKCYDLAGVAEIFSSSESVFRWDADAAGYVPRSKFLVYTFRRKSAVPCAVGSPS